MSDVNKQLLEAVKHCHGIFDQYVSHHLAKPDYDKAAANERHRAICAEAIAAAEQAQQAEPVLFDDEGWKSGGELWRSGIAQQAVPDGYALVPIEPTPEMLKAADCVDWADEDIVGNYHNLWNAMLAAAQKGGEA